MYRLVLLRHGESVWNKENLFTGWTDVGLSDKGLVTERRKADGSSFARTDLFSTLPTHRC